MHTSKDNVTKLLPLSSLSPPPQLSPSSPLSLSLSPVVAAVGGSGALSRVQPQAGVEVQTGALLSLHTGPPVGRQHLALRAVTPRLTEPVTVLHSVAGGIEGYVPSLASPPPSPSS